MSRQRVGQRASKLFGVTLREPPAETDTASHALLVRAGYVRQLAAGIFSYLPLAWRSLRKIEQILREEMDGIGGQEMSMPVVHPAEPWQASGRWYEIDDAMARFQDRRGRDMLLAMTHEEVVALHSASELRSYRQLPNLVYQMQTKFRDEPRARGGLIRVREFIMKDSYSLDRDREGLEKQYQAHYDAYTRIGRRTRLPLTAVRSDVGMMGGRAAHEFMYVTPIGEDTLALCDECGYSANRDVAAFAPAAGSGPGQDNSGLLPELVHTPQAATIADVAAMLGVERKDTAKIVFFVGSKAAADPGSRAGVQESGEAGEVRSAAEEKLIAVVVRGDMEVNQVQVQYAAGTADLRPARDEEIRAAGMVPGFASPIGVTEGAATVVVDETVVASGGLVAGANKVDYHFRHVRCGRDYEPDVVSQVAAVYEGAPCMTCAGPLRLVRGVEVGNIFQLGTKYCESMEARYTDEHGAEQPIWMGSYGIGVGRLLACIAEEHRDDQGLVLPAPVAPFHVSLLGLGRGDEARAATEAVYEEFKEKRIEVLFDDRLELSAGVRFNDSDLRGLPLRVVIGERSLKAGGAELKRRSGGEAQTVPLDELAEVVRDLLESC